MGWIVALIVGGVAGWLASKLMNRDASMGVLAIIVVGCVGSVIGNMVIGPLVAVPASPAASVATTRGVAAAAHNDRVIGWLWRRAGPGGLPARLPREAFLQQRKGRVMAARAGHQTFTRIALLSGS